MVAFKTIDTHTMGQPTRIVTEGFPELLGDTMLDKKKYLEKYYDHYRTALMLEPRGHRDMFGALFTEPCNENADIGVIFMDAGGYLNMCGHGTIGSATAAVELGLVKVTEPNTHIVFEAPAGLIEANVLVRNGKALEVEIINVPAFVYKENQNIDLDEYGSVPYDISFGGSFFALVDSEKIGLPLEQSSLDKLIDFGMRLKDRINDEVEIRHPSMDISGIDLVEIYGPATNPKADSKNIVIFGASQADRSPCGTGTSAKVATLYSKNKLKIGEQFIYESILGSLFKGAVLEETQVDGKKAVIPEIIGSAFITGSCEWVVNENDPLTYGYLLEKEI